jgi:signal transduction histidine kinase
VRLKVLDNGLGIKDIELDEIWLPGKTTTPGGTGFGLTIVKDSVKDMGGKVHAIAKWRVGRSRVYCRITAFWKLIIMIAQVLL